MQIWTEEFYELRVSKTFFIYEPMVSVSVCGTVNNLQNGTNFCLLIIQWNLCITVNAKTTSGNEGKTLCMLLSTTWKSSVKIEHAKICTQIITSNWK